MDATTIAHGAQEVSGRSRDLHRPFRTLSMAATVSLCAFLASCQQAESIIVWGKKTSSTMDADQKNALSGSSLPGEVRVVSNRADLISGGDALVDVSLPVGAQASDVRVDVDGRDVTNAFAVRTNGRYMGLVQNLTEGINRLTARIPGLEPQTIEITNHPRGGPVFSGPQLQPWICGTQDEGLGPPIDAQCNAPSKIAYVYQPQGKKPGEYQDYDPQSPPSDVATTTTDAGITVPYIVRLETGTIDRSIYTIAVLADPSQPWEPWDPQKSWNGKLFVPFGGGCGTQYRQLPPVTFADEQTVLRHEFISRGWMGTASGLNALGQNCNEVLSAEALMMLKEHIAEQYGPIRHTIGRGGSGGSIQQNNIAAAYPGLLDGITTDSSFPDSWTAFSDTIDCNLLNRYFYTVSPRLWLGENKAAVMGKSGTGSCMLWTMLLGDTADPQNRGGLRFGFSAARKGCSLPKEMRYHPVNNPQGARCSAQDFQAAIWGRRGPLNAAPLPFDNEGVQYGLSALQDGTISAEQFVELNSKIGSMNEEGDYVPQRSSMDETTLATFYRSARLSDPRQLAKTPILDIRNNSNSVDFHQPYMSWVMRARLDAANGGHGNQIIWDHPGETFKDDAVFAMDHWVMAIEADRSESSREEKVLRNRPADLKDSCWIDGKVAADEITCRQTHPYSGDARMVAGGPLSSDIRKCQLRSLNRTDYQSEFTDAQWARLQETFPTGVCDWTKPSVGFQLSEPWLTYADGPGGRPLGPAPMSKASGVPPSTR